MAARRRRNPARRWWILGGVGAVALALIGVWFLTRPPAATGPAYDVVTVTRSDQTDTVALSGTIAPQTQANAMFEVGGTLASIRVKVGDVVAKGTPLATLETRDLSDAVALADAQAATARAQLSTVEDSDQATDAQLAAARAQVRSAEASLANAKNRLQDATLTSPIAGTVAKVSYEVGDQVSGSSASSSSLSSGGISLGGLTLPASSGSTASSIVVISTDAWKLDASVGTIDLPSLKPGQAVVVTPTGTELSVRGVVDTVGIVATQNAGATATFPVTIKITDAGVPLYSGASADAIVTTGVHPQVLTVPVGAVTTADGATTVELLRAGTPVTQPVTLGRRHGSVVEVTAGLAEGDQIRVARGQVVQTATPRFGFGSKTPTPTPTK